MKGEKGLFTSVIEYLSRQSKPFLLTWSFTVILFVGSVDYITGEELSFSIFYLLPISLAAWFVNRNAGVFMCILSSVTELYGEFRCRSNLFTSSHLFLEQSYAVMFLSYICFYFVKLKDRI